MEAGASEDLEKLVAPWPTVVLDAREAAQWTRVGTRSRQEQLDKRLRAAVACGLDDVASALLELGANPNSPDPVTGWVSYIT